MLAFKRYARRLDAYLDAVRRQEPWERIVALSEELQIDRLQADLPALLDGIAEGAERTRDIVDGLKRFSALDRNVMEPMDLVPVIERAVRWVGKAAPRSFAIHVDLPGRLPVLGSAGQLQQVAMNLVQNACDATDGQTAARLETRGQVADGWAVLRFADNGPGIAPEHLPHVFEPFFTTKPVGKGTGLGLAISYGIVERHGGRLSVESPPGGGAVFVLKLPLLPEREVEG